MHEWQDEIRRIAKDWLFGDFSDQQFPSNVILPLENPDLYCHEKFTGYITNIWHGRTISVGQFKGQSVGVMRSKFGAPAVAMAIDVLAMVGVKNIIGVGYCGSMEKNINCGDLIIPSLALRDDGTTPHYVDDIYEARPSKSLFSDIKRTCEQLKIFYHEGTIFSTDAILKESNALVTKWRKNGVIAVDMEVGAFFSISDVFNIDCIAVLVASDDALLRKRADTDKLLGGTTNAINLAFSLLNKINS